jgi:adenylate cyclase
MTTTTETKPRRSMRRRLKSLRTPIAAALAGGAAVVVLLAVGLVLAVNLISGVRSATELLTDKIELIIGLIENAVDAELQPARDQTVYLAEILSEKLTSPDSAPTEDLLIGALAATPSIGGVTFVRADGTRFLAMRNDIGEGRVEKFPPPPDPNLAKVLASARAGDGPGWSRPVFVTGAKATYASAHAPVFSGGMFRGVVIAGVSMERLSGLVSKISAEEGLIAFILSGNGVLAHPLLVSGADDLKPGMPLPTIDRFGDGVISGIGQAEKVDLFRSMRDRGVVVRILQKVRGDDWVIITKPLPAYGPLALTAGAYVSLNAVDAPLSRLLVSGVVGLSALVAALFLAIWMGRKLGRPISDMADAAVAVSSLELAAVPEMRRSRIREMDEQARAFNRMIEALRWFERYVPKSLVRRFIAQGAQDIPSVYRTATVCFTDIVGYTRMTEPMNPSDTAALLNRHFEVLAAAVEATDGVVDKYMGDAMMAFWLADGSEDDGGRLSARAAARAAELMGEGIEAENRERTAAGLPGIAVRIGLHTGPLLVGNIGAPGRINYTAVGRTVNIAQRMEQAARMFTPETAEVRIAVSQETARHLDGFDLENLGPHRIRGVSRRFNLYRLIPRKQIQDEPVPNSTGDA